MSAPKEPPCEHRGLTKDQLLWTRSVAWECPGRSPGHRVWEQQRTQGPSGVSPQSVPLTSIAGDPTQWVMCAMPLRGPWSGATPGRVRIYKAPSSELTLGAWPRVGVNRPGRCGLIIDGARDPCKSLKKRRRRKMDALVVSERVQT